MSAPYPALFSPLALGTLLLKNRVVMAPMSTSLGGITGEVTPANIAFYRERALGGFGLIIVEFTCVDPTTGRTEERQLSLDSPRNLPGHARLVDTLHRSGAKAFVQLQHGGRFAPAHLIAPKVPKGPSIVASRRSRSTFNLTRAPFAKSPASPRRMRPKWRIDPSALRVSDTSRIAPDAASITPRSPTCPPPSG